MTRHDPVRILFVVILGALWIATPRTLWAQDPTEESTAPLEEMSLEALLDVEITSVSKRVQKLSHAAAAISVLTGEDIQRLGADHIAEALRAVPGMHVAQISRSSWAVSSRGFSDEFSNKLLVLMDGRSVYTPLFSGVFWDAQDTILDDLERIEVVRGPGATLWGANAVNGVINILSKSSKDTQGWLLGGGYGTEDNGWAQFRYGGTLSEDLSFRVYGKAFDRDGLVDTDGDEAPDDWEQVRGGFRMDFDASESDLLTFQGEIYGGESIDSPTVPLFVPPFLDTLVDKSTFSGGHLLTRYTHDVSPDESLSLQLYYDRTERETWLLAYDRDTIDLDFQHRFKPLDDHELIWGLGYRFTADDTSAKGYANFDPENRNNQLFNAFIQDTIALVENEVMLTLGTKIEHNDFTHIEVQPNARLLWAPDENHSFWGAVSRALRTPARVEHGLELVLSPLPPPAPPGAGIVSVFGDDKVVSEELLATEIGWRFRPTDTLSFDLALFYNDYDDLRTAETGTPFFVPLPPMGGYLVQPLTFDNELSGETYGVELAVDWKPFSNWRLSGSYSFLQMDLHPEDGSQDFTAENVEGQSPHHQIHLHSYLDLSDDWQFNTALYWVDGLPDTDINGYLRLDLNLRWQACENAAVTLGVQNLLEESHPEFRASLSAPTLEAERLAFISFALTF